ncbi:MAG: response regulator [Deltaproteobacteria bacterium]|nr:response regulator [Deltaproteobacteria bacterium]
METLDSRLDAVKRRIQERFGDKAKELEAAAKALAKGDTNALEKLRRIAHKIKGHTRDPMLTKAAAEVEDLAREGNARAALAAVPVLVEAAHSVAMRTRSTPWPPEQLVVTGGPERILVVDDDPTIRQVVSLTLARMGGYEVVVAANVDEASALCETRTFDLAIIDRRLPGSDGVAFAEGVRDRGGAARIVIYSGTGPTSEDEGSDVDDWWEKPLTSQELVDAVEQILAKPARSSASDAEP